MALKFSLDKREKESLGEYLRNLREKKEVSLQEISDYTKIKIQYLRAIEKDNITTILNVPYARIDVLNYARYIDADIKTVLKLFKEQYELHDDTISEYNKKLKQKKKTKKIFIPRILIKIIPLIVFLAAIYIFSFYIYKEGKIERDIFKKTMFITSKDTTEIKNMENVKSMEESEFVYKTEDLLGKYVLEGKESIWYVTPEYIKK